MFCDLSPQRSAFADGLRDLKSALQRLRTETKLSVSVEADAWNQEGDGDDKEERSGQLSLNLTEDEQGIRIIYSRDMLSKVSAEELAKEVDPKAKTPTLKALKEFDLGELRPQLSTADTLARQVGEDEFLKVSQ